MALNGYFKIGDPRISELAGYRLLPDWWSRPYEYAWAMRFAGKGQVVADMGCGWMYRPFKDALAGACDFVYAVDADNRLLQQRKPENLEFIVADFSRTVDAIPDGRLDVLFCISVLEDLGDFAEPSLIEFARTIREDGRIVMTFDVPFDTGRPTPIYPGLPLDKFESAMKGAGLRYTGGVDYSKDGAVNHSRWNLCCFHCVLETA